MKKAMTLATVLTFLMTAVSCGQANNTEYSGESFQCISDPEKVVTRPAAEMKQQAEIYSQDPDDQPKICQGTLFDSKGVPISYTKLSADSPPVKVLNDEYAECFSNVISEFSEGIESAPAYRKILYSPNPTKVADDVQVGKSVRMTYDANIQSEVFSYMRDMNIIGSLVVKRTDGSIAAEISTPGYNANEYKYALDNDTEYIAPEGSLRNKCQDQRAPGSTFKMLSATTALASGVIGDTGEAGVFNDEGCWYTSSGFPIKDWFFSDTFSPGYGPTTRDIHNAFIISSNVVFAKVFVTLGLKTTEDYLYKLFLFGEPIELDHVTLNNNKLGVTDNNEAELALSAFGQGKCTVSPLYIAAVTREVVFGEMVRPFTMDCVVDTANPDIILEDGSTSGEVIASTGGITLKDDMKAIANDMGLSLEGYNYYVKTGTAEVDGYFDTLYVTAFLEAVGKEIKPSYDSYTDYGETNGSYIVTLQVRNAPEISYEFPDPNSIYASHLAPIFNHICYTITAND